MAWRLRRHGLEPVGGSTVANVVRRVIALRGWPLELADLSVCIRQVVPNPGGLARALDDGDVIRSYAFRGGSYVFALEDAADVLSVRTATRVWETKRWQQQGGFALDDWGPLRAAVRQALAAGPLTRDEIAAHLSHIPNLRHLVAAAAGAGADSLYKPLHWWGDICFGPTRGARATFRLLDAEPRWPTSTSVDEAGRRVIRRYLAAYGPATSNNLTYWLTEGLGAPRRRLHAWMDDLRDEVTEVRMDGASGYMLNTDLEALHAAVPSHTLQLLPGFDPWIMGPGTADSRVISPERRGLATKGSNMVIRDGVVCGTWRVRGADVAVSWFVESGPTPATELTDAVHRLSIILDRELVLALT